jgi:chromosomal replication initiator protein
MTSIEPVRMFRVRIDCENGQTLLRTITEEAMKSLRAQIDAQLILCGGSVRQTILEVVSLHFGVSVKDIMGRNRSSATAWARQVVMYLLRSMTSDSCSDIGEYLNKDHGTVIHGDRLVRNRLAQCRQSRQDIDAIKARISLLLKEATQPNQLAA